MPKHTKSDWAQKFDEYRASKATTEPEGPDWKTFEEVLSELECGRGKARSWIRLMVSCGKIEIHDYFAWEPSAKRKVRRVVYRLKK